MVEPNTDLGVPFEWHCDGIALAKWSHAGTAPWDTATVEVGALRRGGFYVQHVGQVNERPRAFRSKQGAWLATRQLMSLRKGDWTRVS